MEYFTVNNTEGIQQKVLDQLNAQFPKWAREHDFNLEDEQDLKTASSVFIALAKIMCEGG